MLKLFFVLAIVMIGSIYGEDSEEFHVHVQPSRPKSAYHLKPPRAGKLSEHQTPPEGLRGRASGRYEKLLFPLLTIFHRKTHHYHTM